MLDLEQYSFDPLVEPAVLVTIVAESVLQDSLVSLLQNLKVKTYTVSQVQGQQRRSPLPASSEGSESSEDTAVPPLAADFEIRAIVSQEVANVIFYVLKEQQKKFAILAYRQKVETMSEG